MTENREKRQFYYTNEDQAHRQRCKEILEKHPEVAKLLGRNSSTFLILLGLLFLQMLVAFWMGKMTLDYWWLSIIIAYLIGAFANHALYVIIHEATHNLIFKNRLLNKCALVLADIPNVVAGGIGFRTYHIKHHSHLGEYETDGDLAYLWEAKLIGNSWWRKALWLFVFPVFQIVHTFRIKSVKTWHKWMYINVFVVFLSNFLVWYFFGWNGLLYLFLSMFFGLGLHPLGARWIQEHYTLDEEQETYSYYGPLNYLALNMGYHNEHHDFPAIPWNKLPELKKMAPEYYDTLKYHKSWTKLLFEFIFNREYYLFSRVVRKG